MSSWLSTESYLFFSAYDEQNGRNLWRSDGTEVGTQMVKDIDIGPNSSPFELAAADSIIYFSIRYSLNNNRVHTLWRSNGTEAGTWQVSDSSLQFAEISEITPIGDDVYFSADDGVHGSEVWISDGTIEGTRLLADVNAGLEGSFPSEFTLMGDTVYFSAYTPSSGRELWGVKVRTTTSLDQTDYTQAPDLHVFPNPFNQNIHINVQTTHVGKVDVSILGMDGRMIRNIFSGQLAAGPHSYTWSGKNDRGQRLSSGIYMCLVRSESGVIGKKIVLIE